MVEFKNNKVRFEDLQVGDTFDFNGKNFLVVEDEADILSCFCFDRKSMINFDANNELVENAKRDGKPVTTGDTPKFVSVTMDELKPGDIFNFVLESKLYMYVGHDKARNSHTVIDLSCKEFEITWFAGDSTYNKLINKECIKKIYSN